MSGGKIIQLKTLPDSTISTIKDQLLKFGYEREGYSLKMGNKVLNDTKTIGEYGIVEGTNIVMDYGSV